MEAQLRQAQYYLDNTTLTAPEDGRTINLQVRPGMVSGIYRVGGIAALIADADRYVIGAQGSAAIYTGGETGAWAALCKISIRAHSWANWFYPLNL